MYNWFGFSIRVILVVSKQSYPQGVPIVAGSAGNVESLEFGSIQNLTIERRIQPATAGQRQVLRDPSRIKIVQYLGHYLGVEILGRIGEIGYIEHRKRQAVDFIKADYPRFAVLCLKRFIYFWAGPPRLAKDWRLAEIKNSLFLASSVLMFWGLGRALRQR